MMSLVITTFLLSGVLSHEQCGFTEFKKRALADDPSLQKRLDDVEYHCKSEKEKHEFDYIQMIRNGKDRRGLQDEVFDGKGFSTSQYFNGILEIPVVVHVLYNPNYKINLDTIVTHERIQSQIMRLNKDYQMKNDDTTSVPFEFESDRADYKMAFKLDQVIRKQVSWGEYDFNNKQDQFSDNDGGSNIIDPEHHLNLYVVVGLGADGQGSTLLGNCALPWFPSNIDGCTMNYKVFGDASAEYVDATWKNDLGLPNGYRQTHGRTTTHEVGHYMNLFHIWGPKTADFEWEIEVCTDSDTVDDIPNQQGPHTGCPNNNPKFRSYSCDSNDMYMNFMDYSDGECKTMFSKGQLERTLSVLNLPYTNGGRKGLVDYQSLSAHQEGKFVNDLYFPVVESWKTQESEICGPSDHLINGFSGNVSSDKKVYGCVSTTDNPYVDVISNMWISSVHGNNCIKTLEAGEYLCYFKTYFTDSSNRMNQDQVQQRLSELFPIQ